jgi:small nuclear ribonucleoprotein (snRNP)-like protein
MKARMAVLAALIAGCFILTAIPLFAEEFQIDNQDTIKSFLEKNVGKTVGVRLQSGEEVTGVVTKVGQHVVHLSKIAGREFYDAVIRIDGIHAVVVRVRGK